MNSKPNFRAAKIHRTYTVKEAAGLLGVHRNTIRRWMKGAGLKHLDDQKPTLISGVELVRFGASRKTIKYPCGLTEAFCFRCREPRKAALAAGEITSVSGTGCNVRLLCETCATVMHKVVPWRKMHLLASEYVVSTSLDIRSLVERNAPSANVHFEQER